MPNKSSNVATKVDPAHYKGFVKELQWIDTMAEIPRYRKNPMAFIGALELQIRKYLDRDGKDVDDVEYRKALFYHIYLVSYLRKGSETRAEDVQKIMAMIDG